MSWSRRQHTHRLDGDVAEVLLGDVCVLDFWSDTFFEEELQQGRVVSRGALRRRRRRPVGLGQQGLCPAVDLRGEKQLGDGRFKVLLLILVFVERLPQLHGHVF